MKTQDRFLLKILIGVGKRYIVSQRKPLMMDSETNPNPRKPREIPRKKPNPKESAKKRNHPQEHLVLFYQ